MTASTALIEHTDDEMNPVEDRLNARGFLIFANDWYDSPPGDHGLIGRSNALPKRTRPYAGHDSYMAIDITNGDIWYSDDGSKWKKGDNVSSSTILD